MRVEYSGELLEPDLPPDWPTMFGRWLTEAIDGGVPEPNAMVLATADAEGRPSARSVLLKGFDERGFTFFTNYDSRKGREIAANPHASLVFPWYPLHRQVLVVGTVEKVDRAETEEYFAVRPRGAQLGAWASPQSTVLESRDQLERAWAEAGERFPEGQPVPPPPHWGGYRVLPESVEFWQGRISRLHDRLRWRYTGKHHEDADKRGDTGGDWIVERLAP